MRYVLIAFHKQFWVLTITLLQYPMLQLWHTN